MNYKQLQTEVKRLAELTGLPCPPLNGKKVDLELALTDLQAANALDIAHENGEIDAIADQVNESDVAINIWFEGIDNRQNEYLNEFIPYPSNADKVAIVLATTASRTLDIALPVATKIARISLGFTLLSLVSLLYFAYSAWQYLAPRVQEYFMGVIVPKSMLSLREGIHRLFYYSQKGYAEAVQIKALVSGVQFIL